MHFEYLLSTVSVLWGSGYTITACVCIWIYNTQSFLWLVWSFHNLLLFLDTIAQPINSLLRLSLRTWYSNSAKASLRFKNNYFWSLTLCTRQVRHTEPQSPSNKWPFPSYCYWFPTRKWAQKQRATRSETLHLRLSCQSQFADQCGSGHHIFLQEWFYQPTSVLVRQLNVLKAIFKKWLMRASTTFAAA